MPDRELGVAGLAFYDSGAYPGAYHGALFFADYTRDCIWAMLPGAGRARPANRQTFVTAASDPVDLTIGPGGDLFYVDLAGGRICACSQGAGSLVAATPTPGPHR